MNPGINHNVPEDEYHAFRAVSKSTLWSFAKNPSKWKKLEDAGIRREPTPAMQWGSLVDAMLLQPEEVERSFAVSPYDDFRTKDAKAWRDAETRTVITQSTFDSAKAAADSVLSNPIAGDVLSGAETQVSVLVEGDETQTGERFLAKSRIDIVPGEPFASWVFDLKTTQSLSDMDRTIANFGYHVQAAWYLDMYNAAAGEARSPWGFVFVESEFPYETAVVELDPLAIERGREWYLGALAKWCKCHRDGKFPSPFDGEIPVISLPKWA